MAPKGPKMAKRWPQGGPKRPHNGPRWPRDGPKMGPTGPKMAPRWPQDGPKKPQDALRCSKMFPRWPQDGPKRHQEAPRWPQDSPKMQVGPTSQLARRFSSKSSRKCSLLLPGCGKVAAPSSSSFVSRAARVAAVLLSPQVAISPVGLRPTGSCSGKGA